MKLLQNNMFVAAGTESTNMFSKIIRKSAHIQRRTKLRRRICVLRIVMSKIATEDPELGIFYNEPEKQKKISTNIKKTKITYICFQPPLRLACYL